MLPLPDLSPREVEVLRLMARGATNEEIAAQLVVALHTVKKYASRIIIKLKVSNRTQAVAAAQQVYTGVLMRS